MKAILLAAGFGMRLRPLTNRIPKCLVPIKGKPLLEIWLETLINSGIGPFLINTHYLADQVKSYITSSPFNYKVMLVEEKILLGTAGTLIANIDFFEGQDGLLIHADNYCLADFDAFIKAHNNRPAGCIITMMTFRTDTPNACGIVELDEKGVVIGFHEKSENPPGDLANGAIYILSADLLYTMKNEMLEVTDFSTEILNRLLGRIYTYETDDTFMDIGTPQNYIKANS